MQAVEQRASRWSAVGRACASAAILAYLAAVVVPPLAGPAPASDLANRLLQPLRPLVGALYLGHGYRFFAPNPGPGHTIRWTMTMPDGSTKSGRIPDETLDRPRLLYHRRFMVSEKISALVPPPDAPPEVRERAVRLVQEQRDVHPTRWAAIRSIAEKIGCTPETLRLWVQQAERDAGSRRLFPRRRWP